MSYQNLNPPPQKGMAQSGYPNPADMPMQNPKDQVTMWQQSSYMVDSGIQSGSTTQAPSISGKEEGMKSAGDWVEGQTYAGHGFAPISESGYSSEQIEDVTQHLTQSRNQKPNVRTDTPRTTFNSSIRNIADSSQMMNIMTYQDGDQETEAAFLTELINMLNDKDHVVVSNAAMMVLKLSNGMSKGQAFKNAIDHSNMVATFVRILATSEDLVIAKLSIEVIYNISTNKEGRLAIFKSGGIKVLVQHLSSPEERIVNCSVSALHNMLLYQEGSKASVRQARGLQELVGLLKGTNETLLAIVIDCLTTLAFKNQESKYIILASNGPEKLVRILTTFRYEKLLWTTAKALKVLSVCSNNKPAIIAAGGMQALGKHLRERPSDRVLINCLWTLRNLSDIATKLDNLEDLLVALVGWMGSSNDPCVVTCCADIISNLTCNNQKNKKIVCQIGGIDRLLETICNSRNKNDITENAVCALRHLTAQHPDAQYAQSMVGEKGGINIVMNLLHHSPKWPVVKAVIGLIKNLSLCPANQVLLRDSGVIHKLTDILMKTCKEFLPAMLSGGGPVFDGVRVEDVVDLILAALNLMGKDLANRHLMRQLNLKVVCSQLLNSNYGSVKREASEIFNKLSMEEIVMKKEEFSPMSPMADVLQSGNLPAYEGTMLLQISKDKSEEHCDKFANVGGGMFREDAPMWPSGMAQMPPDFQDLINAPDGYDPIYGPPSVQNPPNYLGFDHMPIDPMPGLEIGPQHGPCAGSTYGPMDHMEQLPPAHPPNLDYDQQVPPPPRKDTNSMAQWHHKCSYCHQMYNTAMEANACQAKHLQ